MAKKRICKCPDCPRNGKPYTPTSDASLYCSTRCKNRDHYLTTTLEYIWENERIGERVRNRKILEHLYSIKQFLVTKEVLTGMGFSFHVSFLPMQDAQGVNYARFGNSLLKCLNENLFEILYTND